MPAHSTNMKKPSTIGVASFPARCAIAQFLMVCLFMQAVLPPAAAASPKTSFRVPLVILNAPGRAAAALG